MPDQESRARWQARLRLACLVTGGVIGLLFAGCRPPDGASLRSAAAPPSAVVRLPAPRLKGDMSLEEALLSRRSVREYASTPLGLEEVSQLLWAAQGVTSEWGGRTAPSAGALYPLEVYVAAGDVEHLAPGVYKYIPARHELEQVRAGDVRDGLAAAAVDQKWVRDASLTIVIGAVYARTTGKYGERGVTYVHIETGHAAQNVCLQATALELGAVTIGAFHDDQVKEIIGMADDETPLYLIPVGRKKD